MESCEELDEWIIEHYDDLTNGLGMVSEKAYMSMPRNMTKVKFTKLLCRHCGEPKKVQRNNTIYKFIFIFLCCVC
jgi:hypothetical protein